MSHLGELLSGYLDGEVSSEESAAVREHLGDCGACRDELQAVMEARAAVRALPLLEPPAFLLPAEEASHRRRWYMPIAAAAAVVVVAAGLLLARPTPVTTDDVAVPHTELTARTQAVGGAAP